MANEGDSPVWWFLTGLIVALILLVYGLWPSAPRRQEAIIVAACVLVPLGALGIFTIGLPLLFAAGLAVASLGREALPTTDDG